jgi:hypothetical protein
MQLADTHPALGVVRGDRGGDHHLGPVGHMRGVVRADDRLDPRGTQRLAVARLGAVRPRHGGPERARDQRQAAHPGAADPDEVQSPAVPGSHAGEVSGGCGR